MITIKLKPHFFKTILEEVNPLFLVRPDGTSRVYHSRESMYQAVMEEVQSMCDKGYIDFILVLRKLVPVSAQHAHQMFDTYFSPNGFNRIDLVDLTDGAAKTYFRRFFISFHRWAGTTYDEYAFDSAYNRYIQRAKAMKDIKNL